MTHYDTILTHYDTILTHEMNATHLLDGTLNSFHVQQAVVLGILQRPQEVLVKWLRGTPLEHTSRASPPRKVKQWAVVGLKRHTLGCGSSWPNLTTLLSSNAAGPPAHLQCNTCLLPSRTPYVWVVEVATGAPAETAGEGGTGTG